MSKKFFITATVIIVVSISGGFYWFKQGGSDVVDNAVILSQPIIRWQEITITESNPQIAMRINAPRIIVGNSYSLYSEINRAIAQHIESLKADFISAATTAAEDNGETNILNVKTEVLLATPRLISLAFTSTERLAGIKNDDPGRTFLVFDSVNNEVMIKGNEIFLDDLAWSSAVKIMKTSLLAGYEGEPSCDLLFAPKHNGIAASCIGVDRGKNSGKLSLTKDIPISAVQEFIAPSVLSDITQ
ncbi:MAG: hypothetical protein HYX22_00755 [Candidatus Yanofskybacteria bacterium]|nr:hypothetical protein [Candidatus Yanofskybacteria bacterium]